MNDTISNQTTTTIKSENINWRQVGAFLGLTFAATWALDLVIWLTKGFQQQTSALITLQFQMLIPAFFAILLGLFFFKNSPIYYKTYHMRSRWFFYFYLGYTIIYAVIAAVSLVIPDQAVILSATSSSVIILGVIILVAIRALNNSKEFAIAQISGGKFWQWVLYGCGFVLFYILQVGLNAIFNLGQTVDRAALLDQITSGQGELLPMNIFLALSFFQAVILGPLIGLLLGFGEEYGWRGYLQGELIKLGKVRGVLILGVIWGIWHYPIIWMGHNYPGHPIWGTFLMTGYTVLLGFVLGHIMLKTNGIWLVAFLHALNNQVLSYLTVMFYQPESPIFSFGTGLYGIMSLVPIVLILLRDPIWRTDPSHLVEV